MTQRAYSLVIENTLKQKVTERWNHAPCITDVVEAIDMAKYMLDSPTLIRLELRKEGDIDA